MFLLNDSLRGNLSCYSVFPLWDRSRLAVCSDGVALNATPICATIFIYHSSASQCLLSQSRDWEADPFSENYFSQSARINNPLARYTVLQFFYSLEKQMNINTKNDLFLMKYTTKHSKYNLRHRINGGKKVRNKLLALACCYHPDELPSTKCATCWEKRLHYEHEPSFFCETICHRLQSTPDWQPTSRRKPEIFHHFSPQISLT